MTRLLQFDEMPRIVGNPHQITIHSQEELTTFIQQNFNKNPIFTSQNAYPTFKDNQPYQIIIRKLFIDLDDAKKPENAQLDTRKLHAFFSSHNIPTFIAYSGSKGFHIYIALKPTTYVYSDYLRSAFRSIHLFLKDTFKLRTLCESSARPKQLCRLWYTPHVTTDHKINGRYCCPLHPDWIHSWTYPDIITYSTNPTLLSYTPPQTNLLTLDEFLDYFHINPASILDRQIDSNICTISSYQDVNDPFIKKILPRPCIHTQIVYNENPTHFIRFCAVVQLMQLGYSRKWIFDFFQSRHYIDSYRTDICAYQINHIFDKHPPYKHPSCQTIKNNGFCIGPTCHRYFDSKDL